MFQNKRGIRPAGMLFLAVIFLVALVWAGQTTLSAQGEPPVDEAPLNPIMQLMIDNPADVQELDALAYTACVGGMAAGYPCDKVDLLSFTPIGSVGGGTGADAWGWVDPQTGKEYAIMNRTSGTGFLDISDPENPIYLGNLPSSGSNQIWRDAKVYQNYVYIVSDNNPTHGMQIFDLTELRNVMSPPVTFAETSHYSMFGSAHNIVINEDSGYAYAVGTSTCSGGLHIVDLADPVNPTYVGCHSASGYFHDAQCVMYQGPDPDHQGDEICFGYGGNSGIFIVDVTNKLATQQLAFTSYPQQSYTHQGWLTPDQHFIIMDDELDEINLGINTRTRVFDITNLDSPPVLADFFDASVPSTDHNLYVHNGYAFAANYQSGLRILDATDVGNGSLSQAGYFDTYTPDNNNGFDGAWTAYPYFPSGNVAINSRGEGLFIVRPRLLTVDKSQPVGTLAPGETITYTVTITNLGMVTASNIVVTDTLNGVDTILSGATTLDPGLTATYLFTYTITEDDCNTSLNNTVTASADGFLKGVTVFPVNTQIVCNDPPGFPLYMPIVASPD